MRTVLILATLASAHSASSQPTASVGTAAPQLYDRAPWWMREPVIASLGEVRAELPPNRATLSAAYEVVDRSVADATKGAVTQVKALTSALAAYGPEKVRVTTNFSTRPLYAQYRDKDGTIQDNQRADKIDRYAVTASVTVELRDLSLAEKAHAELLAAHPTSTSPAYFRLEPTNATNTELFRLAVADAARRAKEAVAETGTRLGPVKLIDPTGRACSTDVLIAGGPRTFGSGQNDVQEVVVSGAMREATPALPLPSMSVPAPPPPPPAPGGDALQVDSMRLPIQPPLQTLNRSACVVYALAGGT